MTSRVLGALALVVGLVGFSTGAGASTLYLWEESAIEAFTVDLTGDDTNEVDFDIIAGSFEIGEVDVDGSIEDVLKHFSVSGRSDAGLGATLNLTQADPVVLLDNGAGFTLESAEMTLAVDGLPASTVQLVTGAFLGLENVTFRFAGSGDGDPGPPDLDALTFRANADDGELPNIDPIPEPSAAGLFALGAFLVGRALRSSAQRAR